MTSLAWSATDRRPKVATGRQRGGGGEEVHDPARDLPWGAESITGYNIIGAEDLAAAEEIARGSPFIASIRVYEIRSM